MHSCPQSSDKCLLVKVAHCGLFYSGRRNVKRLLGHEGFICISEPLASVCLTSFSSIWDNETQMIRSSAPGVRRSTVVADGPTPSKPLCRAAWNTPRDEAHGKNRSEQMNSVMRPFV